jgi:hypothetical protein
MIMYAPCCLVHPCIKFYTVNLYIKKQVVKTTRGRAFAHEKIRFVYKALCVL